ncbi:uncharacterized protein BJ212DRAFT_1523571 [Suillus subaureus]|uniref:DhaK domain-containing protein n=1 Tax=Suillus subaureus TaxID=48587 RepID=A0A9P7ELV8_9AGAM|nr:uncharacterized protein BJ212DRAFT_1523571 [Suillus subaureus]KAG1824558.1 hypothetical protein BJ212DRAFT_1523571 [Suillus subaureus]
MPEHMAIMLGTAQGSFRSSPQDTICIYNPSDGLVRKSLSGGVAQNPALRPGAGYEPAHTGHTCHRMLTPSLSGDVFASPSAKRILAAIEFAVFENGPTHRDVVVIINNFTGNRLNFGLAMEHARAKYTGLKVVSVLNADDISLLPQTRRDRKAVGMVCPRASASSSAPSPTLSRAKCLGDALVVHLRSIDGALGHCHVPGREPLSGVCCALFKSSCWLTTEILLHLGCPRLMLMSRGSAKIMSLLFMDNLGGISQLEIGAVVEEVRGVLASQKIVPSRVYCAPLMTSLIFTNLLMVIQVPSAWLGHTTDRLYIAAGNNEDDEIDLLALLDAPTGAHSWLCVRSWLAVRATPAEDEAQVEALLRTFTSSPSGISQSSSDGDSTWQGLGIRYARQAALVPEPDMTQFDTVVGDGDCRETFTGGAKAVLVALDSGILDLAKTVPVAFVSEVSEMLEGSIGGTASVPFAIFFTAWNTHTRPGNRSIVDALLLFCTVLSSDASLEDAVMAVILKEGAEKTRRMKARLGRASYVGGGEGRDSVPPDPGTWGVANIVVGFAKGMAV